MTQESDGQVGIPAGASAIMIAGGIGLIALVVSALVGWLQTTDPENKAALYLLAAFGLVSVTLGIVLTAWKVEWTPAGLTVQIPTLRGLSRRTYSWNDIALIRFQRHHWRVDCRDGRFFRFGLQTMTGAAPFLRELARRKIKADHDILLTLASEEQFWSSR